MSSKDKTAYPIFLKKYLETELEILFKPTRQEIAFAKKKTRKQEIRVLLLLYLKVHQYLGYFPDLKEIPEQIVDYVKSMLDYHASIDYEVYIKQSKIRVRDIIRDYLGVKPYRQGGSALVRSILQKQAYTMSDPTDLINVAIDELVKNNYSLPGYNTLERLVKQVRHQVHQEIYQRIHNRLSAKDKQALDELLILEEDQTITPFIKIKNKPGPSTLTQIKLWKMKYEWLVSIIDTHRLTHDLSFTKIRQFASESTALETGDMLDILSLDKRYTLLVSLIQIVKMQTKDELAFMFIKRVRKTHQDAKKKLEELKERQKQTEEELMGVFAQVLSCAQEEKPSKLGFKIKALFRQHGGTDYLATQSELVAKYHHNNYLPLLWRIHATYKKPLGEIVDMLQIQSTNQDQDLISCWRLFSQYRNKHRTFIKQEEFPLSFASKKWRSRIIRTVNGEEIYHRQMLELCLLYYLSEGLQTTDLFVEDSLDYADYRTQLIPWEECQQHLEEFCQQVGLPNNADDFVSGLQVELEKVTTMTDQSFPINTVLSINKDGRPRLKKNKKKELPVAVGQLKAIIRGKMPDYTLLEVLHRTNHWTGYTKHYQPVSEAEDKLTDPLSHYLFTIFGYGCNLGPTQTEKHTQPSISRRVLSRINTQHINTTKIEKGMTDIIDQYNKFDLTHLWGDATTAIADGTHIELIENSLLAEKHIRYGAYGGIAYHHISDTYVALFSHFIACGIWEAVYILDGLIKDKSNLNPNKIHAGTRNGIPRGKMHLPLDYPVCWVLNSCQESETGKILICIKLMMN